MTILDAQRLFPHWPSARQHRWVRAAAYAATCKPADPPRLAANEAQMATVAQGVFAARTLKEIA